MRNEPPISTSSPRETTTSRPGARAARASTRAAALLLTTRPASAPVSAPSSRSARRLRSPRRALAGSSSRSQAASSSGGRAAATARGSGARPRLVCRKTPVALSTRASGSPRAASISAAMRAGRPATAEARSRARSDEDGAAPSRPRRSSTMRRAWTLTGPRPYNGTRRATAGSLNSRSSDGSPRRASDGSGVSISVTISATKHTRRSVDPKRAARPGPGPSPAQRPAAKGPATPAARRGPALGELLDQLGRDIRQLQIDFERFFNGGLPLPPEELRTRIQGQLRTLRNTNVTTVAESFRLGDLRRASTATTSFSTGASVTSRRAPSGAPAAGRGGAALRSARAASSSAPRWTRGRSRRSTRGWRRAEGKAPVRSRQLPDVSGPSGAAIREKTGSARSSSGSRTRTASCGSRQDP